MPPKKRTITEAEPPQVSRRRSGRISSTSKKSSYFQDDGDDIGESSDDVLLPPRKMTKTIHSGSRARKTDDVADEDEEDQYVGHEDEDEDEENGDNDEDDDDGFEGDSATPPPPPKSSVKKGKRGRPPKNAQTSSSNGKASSIGAKPNLKNAHGNGRTKYEEADEHDEDDEDDEDGREVTYIQLPKLRDDGGVEYEDTQIHPNTMHFLGDLKANNKRDWLKLHDPEFRRSLKDWQSFVETLTEKIIEVDETIPELPLKDVIFRIYRDIRFSKDPTPYKPHYSAAWSRTGRKGPYACYYVHLEPGSCFLGGGLWCPEKQSLNRLRASIDERPHRIRRVLTDPEFVRTFLPDAVGAKEEKILKAFAEKNKENALKIKPNGFHPDHRDIHLLKLRNYTIGHKMKDDELLADDTQEKIVDIFRALVPFVNFLNSVVMPDDDDDSDSEEEAVDGEPEASEEEDEEDEEGEDEDED
ncbi:hypothetical protein F5Y18DRAFT_130769 [Xylariaceae sp. FL1019]|nr:hypothetical protein F5Y18DRAFT_130769 [Xylariaceae sp. FL1019]